MFFTSAERAVCDLQDRAGVHHAATGDDQPAAGDHAGEPDLHAARPAPHLRGEGAEDTATGGALAHRADPSGPGGAGEQLNFISISQSMIIQHVYTCIDVYIPVLVVATVS